MRISDWSSDVCSSDLSGILPGLGFGVEPTGKHNDGCFMAVFNVEAFRPLGTFKREVTEFAEYLKATPPDADTKQVLYPGEIEHGRSQVRRRDGHDYDDQPWGALTALADTYAVTARHGSSAGPTAGQGGAT